MRVSDGVLYSIEYDKEMFSGCGNLSELRTDERITMEFRKFRNISQ